MTLRWARAKTSSSPPPSLSIQTGASMCMNKSQDNVDEKAILTYFTIISDRRTISLYGSPLRVRKERLDLKEREE